VTLRFWFDTALQAPLVLLLLAFFAAGALAGMLALLGPLLRSRRRVARLKKLVAGGQGAAPLPPL
jgi:putative membrane protein